MNEINEIRVDFQLLEEQEEYEEIMRMHNNVNRIPKRYIRDMENPMEFYCDQQFKERYRFSKQTINNVIFPRIVDQLTKPTGRGLPIPPILCLLITLRFYATGNYQIVSGDLRGISQPTVSRCIKNVSELIAAFARQEIKFPENQNLRVTMQQFYNIANFPQVTGCIDCTHVPIKSPGGNLAEVYRNRKRSFSINVQVVGGPKLEILDIVARWPGREHDSMIFNNSAVKTKFERGILPGYLLGDSGYPCLPYLMTPVLNPATDAENRYNRSQIRTRNSVERLFGVWKRRFPCLSRCLNNKLTTTTVIIVACAVLYNLGIKYKDEMEIPDMINEDEIIVPLLVPHLQNPGIGHAVRRSLIQRHFV